ncbi:MAG: hypothetical protein IJJ33_13140 [Victivallales bacterium]|nr:hypothetical protein [Victivallales bacterium]
MKITIAAKDSSIQDQRRADFVCHGKNDEVVINQALQCLTSGGTLQLLDGNYCIDAFEQEGNSAVFVGYNEGRARVINIIGDTENKAYNTRFGVVLHVSEEAVRNMDPKTEYRVFFGCSAKPQMPPDWYTYTHVNNVNFRNFYLILFDASRRIRGIDCGHFGSSMLQQVGIYTENYFRERFLHLKPETPTSGCIGVVTCPSSNDEMARIGLDTVCAGGLHVGFYVDSTDKLILRTCTAARCCYGYVFKGGEKTLTLLNCSDEGNTHLPLFDVKPGRSGHISNIDFNIERFNEAFIPDDPDGRREPCAIETCPDSWHGFLSYTLQGDAYGLKRFWKEGHGRNVQTVNQDHSRFSRPLYPEFLETYVDLKLGRQFTWNGSRWLELESRD